MSIPAQNTSYPSSAESPSVVYSQGPEYKRVQGGQTLISQFCTGCSIYKIYCGAEVLTMDFNTGVCRRQIDTVFIKIQGTQFHKEHD